MIELVDLSPMPFGKYKGRAMEDVPASYLHWLWTQGRRGKDANDTVGRYIKANLAALKLEYKDAIWD